METFGEYIRRLRDKDKMPLRKLAAHLDIDQSTLSKIERNERKPVKDMVPILSEVFKVDLDEITIKFLSHKIVYALQDEDLCIEALKVAEEEIKYRRTVKRKI